MSGVRLVILPKAPIPGVGQNRLIPTLAAEGAQQPAQHLRGRTVAQSRD